eukprot:g26807.t1
MAVARSYLTSDVLDFSFELVNSEDYGERLPAEVAFELSVDTDGWVSAAEKRISRSEENMVSSNSDPGKVAGRVANLVRQEEDCYISASGPLAGGQAIESLRKVGAVKGIM